MSKYEIKTIQTLEIDNCLLALYRDFVNIQLKNGKLIQDTIVIQVDEYGVTVLDKNSNFGYTFYFFYEIADINFSKTNFRRIVK